MTRLAQMLLFFAMFSITLGSIHIYIWHRLIKSAELPDPWRRIATIAIIIAAVSVPLSMLAFRLLPFGVSRWLTFPSFVWLGMMTLFFFFFIATDVIRGGVALATYVKAKTTETAVEPVAENAPAINQRWTTKRIIAGGAVILVVCLTAVSIVNAFRQPTVIRQTVRIKSLPRAHAGLKIVQISDLHIGITVGEEWLSSVVEQVNALEPDIIAITGDLIDGYVDQLADEIQPLASLRARHGVFFITGNHEHFFDTRRWIETVESLGIQALRNTHVEISEGADSLILAGVDDRTAKRFGGKGEDIDAALKGCDPKKTIVLLAHQPKIVNRLRGRGVDLVLSGHTHGGQIWPFSYLVRIQQGFLMGHYDIGETQLYINQGTFLWGPPMRLGSVCEITELTLEAAD